ncbi:kynurenine formamidase [Biomphalaria pfeifferi]|uniref:Kynurenine formamidase n=1 Tax=Biomphalaria pfeifferi TaxID=112525 RepID=A0AAD8AXV1_BIOPF|nr:kynurenine formamidase [Biomphalaria pfeifferi]
MRSWHPSLLLVLMSTVSGRIIDLSHKHGPTTFMVPGFEHYNRTLVKTLIFNKDVAVETAVYSSNEHGGTHMDAPLHFYKVGMTLDDIPLENTIAEGVMIDVSDEASKNIEYKVPLEKIHAWEKQNGKIPQQAAVIFNFGWHKKFHNKFEYINTVTDDWSQIKIPSISEEVGNFLYDSRNIKIIGVDTMSPDPMNTGFAPIHIKYLANNKLIVENLNATDSLPRRGFRFHAAPVKYVGASGAQVRAYAIVHENKANRSWSILPTWCLVIILLFSNLVILL